MFQVTRSDAFPIPITEPAARVAILLPDRLGPTMQIMKDWHPASESNGAAKAVHTLHINIDDKPAALPTVDRQRFQSPATERRPLAFSAPLAWLTPRMRCFDLPITPSFRMNSLRSSVQPVCPS